MCCMQLEKAVIGILNINPPPPPPLPFPPSLSPAGSTIRLNLKSTPAEDCSKPASFRYCRLSLWLLQKHVPLITTAE